MITKCLITSKGANMSFNFNGEKYLTISDLQEILPIHPTTLCKMLKNGEISGAGKIGKHWYIPESKLEEFLKNSFIKK